MGKKSTKILLLIMCGLVSLFIFAFGIICIKKGQIVIGSVILALLAFSIILDIISLRLQKLESRKEISVFDFESSCEFGEKMTQMVEGNVFVSEGSIFFKNNGFVKEMSKSQMAFERKNEQGLLVFEYAGGIVYFKFERKLKEQAFLASLA